MNTIQKMILGLFFLAPILHTERLTGVTSLPVGPIFLLYVIGYHFPKFIGLSLLQLLHVPALAKDSFSPGAQFLARYFKYTLQAALLGWWCLCATDYWFPRMWLLAVLVRWLIQFGPLIAPSVAIYLRPAPAPLDLGRLTVCVAVSLLAAWTFPESPFATFIDNIGRSGG